MIKAGKGGEMGGKQKLDLDDTKKLLVNGDMML